MNARPCHWTATAWLTATAAVLGAAFAVAPTASHAVEEQPAPKGRTRVYYGVGSCKNCHTKGYEDPDSFICRGTEIAIWQPNDKHAIAYKVLDDARAQRMGKILGWDVKNKKECLACHTAYFEEKPGIEKSGNFTRDEGVSCVVCHGADVVTLPDKDQLPRLGWVDTHGSQNQQFREAWRKLSRAKKDTDWGMNDLWDPVKRTQLCATCHIGSVEQGRLVTHEMYAAGHPPLPGFEVVTFSNQLPRHWQYLREKNKKTLALVMKFHQSEIDLEETHLLAIGGLVAFRENLKMLIGQAETKDWPELAHFDCYACHHELKSKSWRQERGYVGKPGRPPLREWPTALVELGLYHTAADAAEGAKLTADFQARLGELQAVFDAQPFGNPASVKQKATEMVEWIDSQVKRMQDRVALDVDKGGYGVNASATLLDHLLTIEQQSHPGAKAKRPVPDYDSARQRAWAYQVLHLEAASKNDPKVREKLLADMTADAAWKGLDDYLRLTLPPGQKALEGSISVELERIGLYEPRQYFQHFDAVLKQFKK